LIPFSKQQLIDYLRDHGIHLTKKRGQNFLIDKNILKKLVTKANISSDDLVIEIGGGLGHLTSYILDTGASVIVFEIDFKLAELLKDNFKDYKNVNVICGDFLKVDLDKYITSSAKVLANIPYYITSTILERCFKYMHLIDSMVFTVQKEFAKRVVAMPNSSEYGSLSVFCQVHSVPKILFEISENVFFPIPKVRSSVVRFDKANRFDIFNRQLFFNIVKSIFSYRRKTILNSLYKSPYLSFDKGFIISVLDRCSISINLRGEKLNIVKLVELANNFSESSYK
jgi:16S rRNA (adenine1518-N6/adenine1519-N6)-dimethyltransferase